MKRTLEHLKYLSQDERLRREEEAREKFLRDRQATLDYAFNEGFAEGRAEGRAKGRADILNILQKHLDISTISKVTGLSEEDIKNLKKK